jgi:hypothetical protein
LLLYLSEEKKKRPRSIIYKEKYGRLLWNTNQRSFEK